MIFFVGKPKVFLATALRKTRKARKRRKWVRPLRTEQDHSVAARYFLKQVVPSIYRPSPCPIPRFAKSGLAIYCERLSLRDPCHPTLALYKRQASFQGSVLPKGKAYLIGNMRYGLQFLNAAAHLFEVTAEFLSYLQMNDCQLPNWFASHLSNSLHALRLDKFERGPCLARNLYVSFAVALRQHKKHQSAKSI